MKNRTYRSCGCLKNPSGERHPNFEGYKEISGGFFENIKNGAISRELKFDITIKEIYDLFLKQDKKCALSGLDIQFGVRSRIEEKKKECTASLDRIDNTKGYTINNIQWLHKHVNKMKNTHSQNYFVDICKRIAENNNLKKEKKK